MLFRAAVPNKEQRSHSVGSVEDLHTLHEQFSDCFALTVLEV